jgi:predicted enzyme related to lactoylglutathione lyase
MSLEWEQVVVDAKDPVALGQWWADVLGWVVLNDSHEEFEIRPAVDRLPGLVFLPVPEAKEPKNRLHLDFRPEDQQAEVERFLRAGARRADVGQGEVPEVPWVVLADPEGNEFCVLSARSS